MKPLSILLKREWLEWRRVVLGTILIITFMNSLMLLTVARGSSWFHTALDREGILTMDDIKINDGEEIKIDIEKHGEEIEITIQSEAGSRSLEKILPEVAAPVVFGLRMGMFGIFSFILFLSLFYFSDAIYKERSDSSTLFYRSLPVNDHMLLGSKILAGLSGVMALTLFLSFEFLLFTRVAIWIMGEPFATMTSFAFAEISFFGIAWDWFTYLLYAAIRMAPLALFLMLVGSYVKGRPLLIGIGAPLLVSISWAIIFKSAALLNFIGTFMWGFTAKLFEQWEQMEKGMEMDTVIYGNFWGYLFNVETLLSLLVSGLLYYGVWHTYRKNIPTG